MSLAIRHSNPGNGELEIFGTLCFLASFDARLKHESIRRLEDRFLWPSKLGLTNIFRDTEGQPIAAMVFAYLSPEIETRYLKGVLPRSESELMSGHNLWVTHLMSPFTDARKLLRPFARSGTGGRIFHYLKLDADGNFIQKMSCSCDISGKMRLSKMEIRLEG